MTSADTCSEDSIGLALALARTPSRFPELLHGRGKLPRDMVNLLHAAAGNIGDRKNISPLNRPSASVQEAAVFFIEHVLLSHNADHYRVLGLPRTASRDAIKEHHRLLMRLFHPDRHQFDNERQLAIATRVNQAYSVLRSPETRKIYDSTLGDIDAPPIEHINLSATLNEKRIIYFKILFFRYLPQLSLGIIALISSAVVIAVYFEHSQYDLVKNLSYSAASLQGKPESLPPPSVKASSSEPAKKQPSSHHTAAFIGEEKMPHAARHDEASNTNLQEAGSKPSSIRTSVGSQNLSQSKLEHSLKPISTPPSVNNNLTVATEQKVEFPSQRQLVALIENFSEKYERGDVENIARLFSPTIKGERGSRKNIINEYAELFRNTDSRTIYIWDINWVPIGETLRGEANFQARLLFKGDHEVRTYNGTLVIDVVQKNEQPLIIGLQNRN